MSGKKYNPNIHFEDACHCVRDDIIGEDWNDTMYRDIASEWVERTIAFLEIPHRNSIKKANAEIERLKKEMESMKKVYGHHDIEDFYFDDNGENHE